MARRFRGSDTFKVDAKGRVSIPAPFRRVIEASDPDWKDGLRPSIVIVYGPESQDWLEVFSMEAIHEMDEQIGLMQRGSKERKAVEDLMYGRAMEAQIDDDGRLTIPQKLREQIGLKGEAFFISAGDYFRIWNPETYAATGDHSSDGDDPRSLLPSLPPKG